MSYILKEQVFIKIDHKTHHLDCDCSLGYGGTCHWCNYILIYISIHTVESSILMCNSFQNILEDRLSNKVKQTVLAFIIIACAIIFYFLNFFCSKIFCVGTSSTHACIVLLQNPTCDSHSI